MVKKKNFIINFNYIKLITIIFIIINIIIFVYSNMNLHLFNSLSDNIKNNIGYYSKELNNMSFFSRIYASNYKLISIIFLIFNLVFLVSSIGLFLSKNWVKKNIPY